MNKIFIICFIFLFLISQIPAAFASGAMSEFLCELGAKYYLQGRLDDALHEFKKALLVEPSNQSALKYIQAIQERQQAQEASAEVPATFRPVSLTPEGASREVLDLIEMQQEMVQSRLSAASVQPALPVTRKVEKPKFFSPASAKTPKIAEPQLLLLDESFANVRQPIELPQGESVVIRGNGISRFLVTVPEIVTVEKNSADELLVTAKSIGYTFVHAWDANGRWTVEFHGTFPKIEGMTVEEYSRATEQRARDFKLRYSMDWSSFETGKRIHSFRRSAYSWGHNLSLDGESPYGDMDSALSVQRYKTSTDLTYFTLGLDKGVLGPFRNFSFRGFDISPPLSNLISPGESLRGAMFSSPAFNNKFNYMGFWGREGGGRYGNLSPSLGKIKSSFLEGANFSLSPDAKQNYQFTLAHGYGNDRPAFLEDYGFDFLGNVNLLKPLRFSYETAYDTHKSAHLLNWRLTGKKVNFTAQYRDINRSFRSMVGNGWSQGQLGWLYNLNYDPTDKFSMTSSLDMYQDRLFPAEDSPKRWNEDYNWGAAFRLDPSTSLTTSYAIANDPGKISQNRFQSAGAGISKTYKVAKRDIYTYMNANHQESINFTTHGTDYINDRLYAGLRFSIIGQLNYYLNREINFLRQRFNGQSSRPSAWETGLDWQDQFFESPFYGNFRFTYRNEEDTTAELSFLSGEDYIEGYSEVGYRTGDKEIYGACTFRNIWAENPNALSRMEMSFNAGMRYIWDTGWSWESIGDIEGYVFKDLNSDGLRQRDEPPIEGIRVFVGKDKSAVTDIFGYYKFKGVRARKAYVSIDTSKLPPGFVLTVPATQEVAIVNNRTQRVDFGMIARSEISGTIFEDANGDGELTMGEKVVGGVVMILDGGRKAVSDRSGRYTFSNVAVGEHLLTLKLDSLPVYYLPKVAVKKQISLFEGISYVYNIPLKKIK